MQLRDAFVYTALIALALAGIRIGGAIVSVIVFLVFIVCSFRLIVAFVGSPAERPAAIGFAVPTTVYAVMLAVVGSEEFGTRSPHLLTSQFAAMAVQSFKNGTTSTKENKSLFHAIIALGAIGSYSAQETVRVRSHKNSDIQSHDPVMKGGESSDPPKSPFVDDFEV
jgi:hypothetical protein